MVLVTHDVDEAIDLADRVVLLGESGVIRSEWQLDATQRHGGAEASGLRAQILSHYREPVGEPV